MERETTSTNSIDPLVLYDKEISIPLKKGSIQRLYYRNNFLVEGDRYKLLNKPSSLLPVKWNFLKDIAIYVQKKED